MDTTPVSIIIMQIKWNPVERSRKVLLGNMELEEMKEEYANDLLHREQSYNYHFALCTTYCRLGYCQISFNKKPPTHPMICGKVSKRFTRHEGRQNKQQERIGN